MAPFDQARLAQIIDRLVADKLDFLRAFLPPIGFSVSYRCILVGPLFRGLRVKVPVFGKFQSCDLRGG
ncbi:hypothetical protein D3C86_2257450 [compost metagenome]